MLAAVHSDRSGRVFVSGDYAAAAHDGVSVVTPTTTVPLPQEARLVPLDREAVGIDRAGHARPLGRARWALGALLPSGWLRLLHPAYREERGARALDPLPYAAVCAGEDGGLRVPAMTSGTPVTSAGDPEPLVRAGLRARPSSRLVRQLARCAREYGCVGARCAFAGSGRAAITVAAPPAERPPAAVAPRWVSDESPTDPAAFRPTAEEIADLGAAHLAGGGEEISFGRACEGDPLLAARLIEDAVRTIRERTARGRIHIETAGASPTAVRRLADAGVRAITVRLASARSATYELIHGPIGHRWSDVRATLLLAKELGLDPEIALLVCPGLTDRPSELEALVELLDALPGVRLAPRDLAADPLRAVALAPSRERPIGVAAAIGRMREALSAPSAGA